MRSDRARPLLIGLAVFTTGLVLAGTAASMGQLAAGRAVQGLGSGAINTASFVLIARVFDARQRPRMFTYISTAWVLPSFVGPAISAWLTETFSWQWVFWAVVPLVALGTAMVLPTLLAMIRSGADRTAEAGAGRPVPLWAAGVAAVAAAALQLAGQRLDVIALILLVGGLAGLAVGVPPLMPRGFGRWRGGLPTVVGVRGLPAGAFVGAEAFVPLMLVEQRQISLGMAGAVLTVGSVGWTTGSYLQSRSWLRLRRDRLITLGCGSLGLGIGITALPAALQPTGNLTLTFGVLLGTMWVIAVAATVASVRIGAVRNESAHAV